MNAIHGLVVISLLSFPSILLADADTIPLGKAPAPTVPGAKLGKEKAKLDPNATLPPAIPYIASLDTFGSPRISEKILRQAFAKKLDAWLKKGITGDLGAAKLQEQLTADVKRKWKFPFAEFSIMQYMNPGDLSLRITLDVVEASDVARRMPFHTDPTETTTDPLGIIEQWLDYQKVALELAEKGELEGFKVECPQALHCLFGHTHPKLKKYGESFAKVVNQRFSDVETVLTKDKRQEHRGAAAFLLAYSKDGGKVVTALVDRIKDPSALVRNNALRVLGDIAELHPQYAVPLEPVLDALEYPVVTDRAKALFIAFAMAEGSEPARQVILKKSIPQLLALLQTEQPSQSGVAYAILRRVSNQTFAPTDVAKWQEWANRLPASKAAEPSGPVKPVVTPDAPSPK